MSIAILDKTRMPSPRALVLPCGATKNNQDMIVPVTEQDFRGAQIIAREVLSKYGYDNGQIDQILGQAETNMFYRHSVWQARCELRRAIEGNGRWTKKNGHWVLKERYR